MTSHKYSPRSLASRCRLPRHVLEQRVDPAVAGHDDSAAYPFATEVRFVQPARREQQFCLSIDSNAEILLWPGIPAIMAAQPGLDVGHRHARHDATQGATKSTRRVALDDNQLGTLNFGFDSTRDLSDMGVRIGETHAL